MEQRSDQLFSEELITRWHWCIRHIEALLQKRNQAKVASDEVSAKTQKHTLREKYRDELHTKSYRHKSADTVHAGMVVTLNSRFNKPVHVFAIDMALCSMKEVIVRCIVRMVNVDGDSIRSDASLK